MKSKAVLTGMLPRIESQFDKMSPECGGQPSSRILSCILSFVYILYSLEAGIFLVCLPWLRFWENNYVLYLYPQLRPIVANPFFKGAVLGLGIGNLLIGIQEIVHFRKISKGIFSR
jgi:hypothetical protein